MARLVPLAAGSAPEVELQRPVLLFGRHVECDVRIDSPQISRRHCCVAIAYDRIVIRDLGSRNGVRVNGRIVDEQSLRPGDEIAIGHVLYRLDAPESIPTPAPARPASAKPAPRAAPAPKPAPQYDPLDADLIIPLDD